jgi:hypothetical protein
MKEKKKSLKFYVLPSLIYYLGGGGGGSHNKLTIIIKNIFIRNYISHHISYVWVSVWSVSIRSFSPIDL